MGTLQFLFAISFTVLCNFDWCYGRVTPKEPRIVIVGAGLSGIAAATKLIENGFKNIAILEAEDRIGGRIYTTKLGEYNIDLGGQWVHGEGENAAFKLAYPLGLLEKRDTPLPDISQAPYINSKGNYLEENIHKNLTEFFERIIENEFQPDTTIKSFGEFAVSEYHKTFANNTQLMEQKTKYLHLFQLLRVGPESSPHWYDISVPSSINYKHYKGDELINWKTRGYSTILDVLLKRYPDPAKELPVMEKTLLNTEVISIDYLNNTEGPPIFITTAKGQLFKADHVVVTVSLGVLKAKHDSLFIPPLPAQKVKAIEGIGFGRVGKIFLLFDKPFWNLDAKTTMPINFLWEDDDRRKVEEDPEKMWTMGLTFVTTVEHKPNLLEFWISGDYAIAMEELPEETVLGHLVEHMNQFLGKSFNVTTPIGIKRTNWYHNPHFRGTYSYASVTADKAGVIPKMLEEPIDSEKLTVLFAGEATHKNRFSTADGAIETGWKAADRLIEHYDNVLEKDL